MNNKLKFFIDTLEAADTFIHYPHITHSEIENSPLMTTYKVLNRLTSECNSEDHYIFSTRSENFLRSATIVFNKKYELVLWISVSDYIYIHKNDKVYKFSPNYLYILETHELIDQLFSPGCSIKEVNIMIPRHRQSKKFNMQLLIDYVMCWFRSGHDMWFRFSC